MEQFLSVLSQISSKGYVRNLRKEVGEAISKICEMEEVVIIKEAPLPVYVHMYVSSPSNLCVSKTV